MILGDATTTVSGYSRSLSTNAGALGRRKRKRMRSREPRSTGEATKYKRGLSDFVRWMKQLGTTDVRYAVRLDLI
jgi:hypothetical protein